MSEKKPDEGVSTLRDDEMVRTPKVDRRGALGALGAVVTAGIAALLPRSADATTRAPEGETEGEGEVHEHGPDAIAQGCTDRDRGRFADPPGNGRRCYQRRRRSCSDSDGGRFGDPAGRGRRCR